MWWLMADEFLLVSIYYHSDHFSVAVLSLFDTCTVGLTYTTFFFLLQIFHLNSITLSKYQHTGLDYLSSVHFPIAGHPAISSLLTLLQELAALVKV